MNRESAQSEFGCERYGYFITRNFLANRFMAYPRWIQLESYENYRKEKLSWKNPFLLIKNQDNWSDGPRNVVIL